MTSNRASSSPPPQASDLAAAVIALYGPTASGKSAVAAALLHRLDAEVVSADSAALYAGLPILTAAPDHPARLVGIVPLSEEVSVGSYQQLAHEAIDEIVASGRTALVVGRHGPLPAGGAVGARAAAAARRRCPRAVGARLRRRRAAPPPTRSSPGAIPPRRSAIHPNDRRRVVRALELNEAGSSLAPAPGQLVDGRGPPSDARRRARPAAGRPRRADRGADADDGGGRGRRGGAARPGGSRSRSPRATCSASRRSQPCRRTRRSRRSPGRRAASPAISASGSASCGRGYAGRRPARGGDCR